jgi:hypothetical protein
MATRWGWILISFVGMVGLLVAEHNEGILHMIAGSVCAMVIGYMGGYLSQQR